MQTQPIESSSALEQRLFKKLQDNFKLTDYQIEQMSHYAKFLLQENKKINLTGHKDLPQVVSALFADALWASKFVDFNKLNSICDVGTGAGFPGLAIKIAFPHLKVFLIELTAKRVDFLERVVQMFALQNVEIVSLDWRTFNRKTRFDIDLFLSKAAFGDLEICRMFRSNCNYQDKRLIYWASSAWESSKFTMEFVGASFVYKNGSKSLKLVEFRKPEATN